MLDHYKAMIAGCRARGLTPFVTFNQFTKPRWFAARGGWSHSDAPDIFARFCEQAARHLADGIGYATTLNEPNLSSQRNQALAEWYLGQGFCCASFCVAAFVNFRQKTLDDMLVKIYKPKCAAGLLGSTRTTKRFI